MTNVHSFVTFTRNEIKEMHLKLSELFSLITSDIFQLTHLYRYQFGEVMTGM